MREPRLQKYGITTEMYREARSKGLKWCSWHKDFEDAAQFNKGCKICREGSRLRDRELYEKFGNARKHHAPKNYYEDSLLKQEGHCALCPAVEGNGFHVRLHIDHDHNCCSQKESCGKCLRGLLCWECNHRLGRLEEWLRDVVTIVASPSTWTSLALAYLNSYKYRAAVTAVESQSVMPMYPTEDHRGMHVYPAMFGGDPADLPEGISPRTDDAIYVPGPKISRPCGGFTFPNRPCGPTKISRFDKPGPYDNIVIKKYIAKF